MKFFHKYKAFYPYFLSVTALKKCSFQQGQAGRDHDYYMAQAEKKAAEYIKWFMTCHGIPGLSYAISLTPTPGGASSCSRPTRTDSFGFTNAKLKHRDNISVNFVNQKTMFNIGGITTLATAYLLVRGSQLKDQVDGIPINSLLLRRKSFGDLLNIKSAMAVPEKRDIEEKNYPPVDVKEGTIRDMEKRWVSGFIRASYAYGAGYNTFVDELEKFYNSTGLTFILKGMIRPELNKIVSSGHKSITIQDHKEAVRKILELEHSKYQYQPDRPAYFYKLYGALDVYTTASDLAMFGRKLIDCYNNGRMTSAASQRTSPERNNPRNEMDHRILQIVFDHAGINKIKHNMANDDGRLRLGWTPCLAVNRVPELENYGTVDFQGQQFFISSEYDGFSSILLMKGVYQKTVQPTQQDKQRRDKTSVAILCNLGEVTLYELADRIAAIYEEQDRLYTDQS